MPHLAQDSPVYAYCPGVIINSASSLALNSFLIWIIFQGHWQGGVSREGREAASPKTAWGSASFF